MTSPLLPHEPPDGGSAERFIEFMVSRAMLEPGAADRARGAMEKSGQPIDTVLSELGLMGEVGLAEAQAAFLDVPVTRREDYPDEAVPVDGLSPEFLQAAGLLPLGLDQDGLTVATARPLESDTIRSVAFYLDVPVRLRVALRSEIEAALRSLYGDSQPEGQELANGPAGAAEDDVERLKDFAREAPIIRLVTRLVSEAVERGASDIHLEPTTSELRVRRRVDGALHTTEVVSRGLMAGVVTRIKILANLNIAERRLPQDGRMRIAVKGRDLDIRVSTTPTLNGESVVLRILDRASVPLNFSALGFSSAEESAIRDLIRNPNGIVLVTGPTGSGKTTTLYAALLELNREDTKIFTVEDPIEYQLPGISQMQVKSNVGLDFAACLRSILRQDPDIVMVGEIRDAETARIAIQAALTGHLVLSTLHTNSAAASITRLLDMGIDGYLVASTIRGIVAQRLVRRVCQACKASEALHPSIAEQFGEETDSTGPISVPLAAGCHACNFTGYSGRTTIAEILRIDPGIRRLILDGAPEEKIEELARGSGIASLARSGLAKARCGETTVDEILHITRIEA